VIGFLAGASPLPWQFRTGQQLAVNSRLQTNSSDIRRDAALAGVGIVHMFEFHIADELALGRLETVLVDHEPPPKPIHALYAGPRAATPKIRVFLDWASALIRAKSGVGKPDLRSIAHRGRPGKSRA
jgi:DNA-binding transcriptional LysR family regulator